MRHFICFRSDITTIPSVVPCYIIGTILRIYTYCTFCVNVRTGTTLLDYEQNWRRKYHRAGSFGGIIKK